MVSISVPVSTPLKGFTCGAVAAWQVLRFYGRRISKQQVLSLLNIKEGMNTDIPSVALALIKAGLSPTIFLYFPHVNSRIPKNPVMQVKFFYELSKKLGSPKKVNYIKKIIRLLDYSIRNDSVRVFFKKFTKRDIKNFLLQGLPLITVVNSKIFSKGKLLDSSQQHILVINGMTREDFILTSTRVFTRRIRDLMNAIYAARVPSLLVIRNG
ncbi:MAG: hypothetical protein QXT19_04945 [Candidatus Woesearchaeota archaeon]